MGKLYMVSVSVEADLTIPVEASSEKEAEMIASDSFLISDCDFDTWTTAREVDKCPKWAENEIAEGSGGKTCSEVMDGDDYKDQRRFEMEEAWPKLPGFEHAIL